VLQELGLDEAAGVMRVVRAWEQAVGSEVARHCRPTALRGSVLEAEVDSSAWCQELSLRAPELLAGLRRALGEGAPTRLRLHLR
jgi:predicted nucleic acid-binding Zn ribbon protein